MKEYEITYLEKPGNESGAAGLIEGGGGKVLKTSPLGERALVYPIRKQSTVSFKSIVFQMSPEKLSDLEGKLRLEEGVLRYIITKPIATAKMELGLSEGPTLRPQASKVGAPKPTFQSALRENVGAASVGKKIKIKRSVTQKEEAKPTKVSKKAIEKELEKILGEENA